MQFCLCLFIPNCTRNHVITCTYSIQRVEERRRKRRNWRKASVSPFEVGKTLKAPFSQGKMSQRILSVIVAVYKNWFQLILKSPLQTKNVIIAKKKYLGNKLAFVSWNLSKQYQVVSWWLHWLTTGLPGNLAKLTSCMSCTFYFIHTQTILQPITTKITKKEFVPHIHTIYQNYMHGLTLQPVGSPMRPAFTQWRLNFHAWSPTWTPR